MAAVARSLNEEQPLNAQSPMRVRLDGSSMALNEEQPENA